ncbi:hypothetical protein LTR37_007105 [Vermiconidia calcicola]|uniref:Uncharacterized protein n=1 Tax=Vermiconidia calcicola TaxID=1690605 RepID=A0ACC3NEF4_9PEZI|nr:hypothetical protein LTR37_007105 [Vermiconidia calcicola]
MHTAFPVLAVVVKTFSVTGYLLLYAFAMSISGGMGYGSVKIAETWILEELFGDRLEGCRDYFKFTRGICMLGCGTGFLIVAVGLLVMHMVGGLAEEYDQVAVQVLIASFGVFVFCCLCLAVVLVGASGWWVMEWAVRCVWKAGILDEETGLLQGPIGVRYGAVGAADMDEQEVLQEPQVEDPRVEVPQESYGLSDDRGAPARTWIKMYELSSVRNLDVRRMRRSRSDSPSDSARASDSSAEAELKDT